MNIPKVWQSFYGEALPIAHLLRQSHPRRWQRFHALPDSRRYAKNKAETGEILRRAEILATEILGRETPCLCFFPNYATERITFLRGHFFGQHNSEDLQITLFSSVAKWESQRFELVLRAVANDEIRHICWMNTQTGEIFAPYDGGFDLFLRSPQRCDTQRLQNRDWLSQHPQGL